MKLTHAELGANIRAAISRELHLADIPHDQADIHVTVYNVPYSSFLHMDVESADGEDYRCFRTDSSHAGYSTGLLLWSEHLSKDGAE
jgi:hypothetical protein